ncbi:MAG TPA: DUF6516 family protein [Steroidobacteraceae bacterium]|nr:DUF6516 family protein [Steroidobacteraceae bacterium]
MVIWRVPRPVKGSSHPYKYRLFYGSPQGRIVGYDNERGKVTAAMPGSSALPAAVRVPPCNQPEHSNDPHHYRV